MSTHNTTSHENEQERLNRLERWYIDQQLSFDKRLLGLHHRTIREFFRGTQGLELGSADGQMTVLLVKDFAHLTTVDGSQMLLDSIPDSSNLTKVCSLFEEYEPQEKADTIIMEHILEHVDDPVALVRRAATWLAPGGVLIAGVPNGQSFHRLAAVKMGLLQQPCELNSRDLALGHRRVYTPDTFRADLEQAGLRVQQLGGVFFKPLTNQQIQDHWTEEMIEGFYELGKDFPENAAEIFAVCEA